MGLYFILIPALFSIFLILQNDTFHIRWSYSEEDPIREPADLSELPTLSRSGSRSLHLFESTHRFNQKTADALQWKVQSNSVTLPAKHTLYWCTMLKLPEMPGKHHMIGYKPFISGNNRRYVHHMMLYECHDEVIKKLSIFLFNYDQCSRFCDTAHFNLV